MNEAKKKQKAARKLLNEERNTEIPIHSPFKKKYPDLSTCLGPAVQKTRNAGSNEPILAERYPFACPHVPYW